MLKNISNLGTTLENKELKSINGGFSSNPCPGDTAAKASCVADGGFWIPANHQLRTCGWCKCNDGTHDL